VATSWLRVPITALVLLPLVACASGATPPPTTSLIRPIVTVKYINSSVSTVVHYVELTVEEDGGLASASHTTPHSPCAGLSSARVAWLSSQLRSPEVRSALAANVVASSSSSVPVRLRVPPDPAIVVVVEDSISAFPAAEVPRSLWALVAAVDAAFHEGACPYPPPAIQPLVQQ
jgi:hypothetical protein